MRRESAGQKGRNNVDESGSRDDGQDHHGCDTGCGRRLAESFATVTGWLWSPSRTRGRPHVATTFYPSEAKGWSSPVKAANAAATSCTLARTYVPVEPALSLSVWPA